MLHFGSSLAVIFGTLLLASLARLSMFSAGENVTIPSLSDFGAQWARLSMFHSGIKSTFTEPVTLGFSFVRSDLIMSVIAELITLGSIIAGIVGLLGLVNLWFTSPRFRSVVSFFLVLWSLLVRLFLGLFLRFFVSAYMEQAVDSILESPDCRARFLADIAARTKEFADTQVTLRRLQDRLVEISTLSYRVTYQTATHEEIGPVPVESFVRRLVPATPKNMGRLVGFLLWLNRITRSTTSLEPIALVATLSALVSACEHDASVLAACHSALVSSELHWHQLPDKIKDVKRRRWQQCQDRRPPPIHPLQAALNRNAEEARIAWLHAQPSYPHYQSPRFFEPIDPFSAHPAPVIEEYPLHREARLRREYLEATLCPSQFAGVFTDAASAPLPVVALPVVPVAAVPCPVTTFVPVAEPVSTLTPLAHEMVVFQQTQQQQQPEEVFSQWVPETEVEMMDVDVSSPQEEVQEHGLLTCSLPAGQLLPQEASDAPMAEDTPSVSHPPCAVQELLAAFNRSAHVLSKAQSLFGASPSVPAADAAQAPHEAEMHEAPSVQPEIPTAPVPDLNFGGSSSVPVAASVPNFSFGTSSGPGTVVFGSNNGQESAPEAMRGLPRAPSAMLLRPVLPSRLMMPLTRCDDSGRGGKRRMGGNRGAVVSITPVVGSGASSNPSEQLFAAAPKEEIPVVGLRIAPISAASFKGTELHALILQIINAANRRVQFDPRFQFMHGQLEQLFIDYLDMWMNMGDAIERERTISAIDAGLNFREELFIPCWDQEIVSNFYKPEAMKYEYQKVLYTYFTNVAAGLGMILPALSPPPQRIELSRRFRRFRIIFDDRR
ncbi:hypothetical protein QBC38DRAFT_542689 [Podospora fimiseda]|uniref:Uncharacterized protein n=1 Tax=Podospora fimiseda TaxID=252190 RepID=A0AAN7GZV6_9PEZI|nr:hypothetical protein QBC38DRAFT_542689 [Podospora fimiseda]